MGHATHFYKVEKQQMILEVGKYKNSPCCISHMDIYLNTGCYGNPKDRHIQAASRNLLKSELETSASFCMFPLREVGDSVWGVVREEPLTSVPVLGQF